MKNLKLEELKKAISGKDKISHNGFYNYQHKCGCPLFYLAESLGLKFPPHVRVDNWKVINFLVGLGYSYIDLWKFINSFDKRILEHLNNTGSHLEQNCSGNVGQALADYLAENASEIGLHFVSVRSA